MSHASQFRHRIDGSEILLQYPPTSFETLPGASVGFCRSSGVFLDSKRKKFKQKGANPRSQAPALEASLQRLFIDLVNGLRVMKIGHAMSAKNLPADDPLCAVSGEILTLGRYYRQSPRILFFP